MFPLIDKEKCIGCGACVAVCPNGALSIVDGKAVVDKDKCKGAWQCISVCPTDAINKPL